MRRALSTVALALVATAPLTPTASAARPVVTAISVAGVNGCALRSDGTVRCWGANGHGQLGDGTRRRRLTAVAVRGLTDAKAISIGTISCALIAGGTVKCWGDNRHGQLGDGTTTTRLTPVTVSGLGEAVAIAVGSTGACALLADRTVRCWGANQVGGLGNGTRTASRTPVAVSGLTGVTAISYEDEHGCALLTGGTVACWGWNGREGLQNRPGDQLTPAVVPGVSGAVAIGANAYNDCALLDSGLPECWDSYAKPHPVRRFGRVLAYAWSNDGLQTEHDCALMPDRTVKCYSPFPLWGQLGNGSRRRVKRPVTVRGVHGAIAISTTGFHTCALLADGIVKCWGEYQSALNDDRMNTPSPLPAAVRGLR